MEAMEQFAHVVLFTMLILIFKSVDETQVCDHSNGSYCNWAVLSRGTVYYAVISLISLRFQETLTCWNWTRSMFALISLSGIWMEGESLVQFNWSDFPCCNLRAASSNRPLWSMAITWKNNTSFIKRRAVLKSFVCQRRIKFVKSVRMARVTQRHRLLKRTSSWKVQSSKL